MTTVPYESLSHAKWDGKYHLDGRAGRKTLAAPPDSFALGTIGEAFHRLDQQRVATHTLQWLQPGGCVVIMGCYGITSGKEPWQRIVVEIVRQGTSRTAAHGTVAAQLKLGSGPDHNERVLRETGFRDVASYPFVEPHDWIIETILGNLYSTSFCSKRVLGRTSRTHSHKPLNLLITLFIGHIDPKNN